LSWHPPTDWAADAADGTIRIAMAHASAPSIALFTLYLLGLAAPCRFDRVHPGPEASSH